VIEERRTDTDKVKDSREQEQRHREQHPRNLGGSTRPENSTFLDFGFTAAVV